MCKETLVGMRVLVAEDTQIARLALQTMLEDLGCHVVATCDGKEAVEQFDSSFDMVFTDYNMPIMRGDEAVEIIRQNEKKLDVKKPVYIVGLTANNSEETNQSCFAAGINQIVEKPIRQEKLKELLTVAVNLKN